MAIPEKTSPWTPTKPEPAPTNQVSLLRLPCGEQVRGNYDPCTKISPKSYASVGVMSVSIFEFDQGDCRDELLIPLAEKLELISKQIREIAGRGERNGER